ncbi:MAG: signal peptidase I [Methanofollis sp.]|uniref:signal peptidase I n=1 Tax=Methanofollis sp. TaxID=2052835 RepID=UPI00261A3776|nr:signal peptidase I [Methanofollis sp.]MDD4255013.1 signal peptidase I [Methanofollis sp.]
MKKPLELLAAIALVLVAAAALTTPAIGWHVEVVLSGSMEPAIPVGGVVVIGPASPDDVRVGDVITFKSGENRVTHRVVAVEAGSPARFLTKGDANEDADPVPVPAGNVVGRVLFSLPFLGYLAAFVRSPIGFVLTLVVPGLVLIALEVKGLREGSKSEDKEGG